MNIIKVVLFWVVIPYSLVDTYAGDEDTMALQATLCYNPEHHSLDFHCIENLNAYK
jgi:hypothetical protein